jgi:hypothetical protein
MGLEQISMVFWPALCLVIPSRVRRDIRFEANISKYMKRIVIRFETNKTSYIRLFCIEANQQVLYVKRIKKEAKIPC